MTGWVVAAGAVIGAAGSVYAANQQNKAAKAAAQPRTTTSSPYMAERINPLIPYLMAEQQRVYESRMRGYGLDPGDFSPIAAQLAGIGNDYTGVGAVGSYHGTQPLTAQQLANIQATKDRIAAAGGRANAGLRAGGIGGMGYGLGAGAVDDGSFAAGAGGGGAMPLIEYWR